jgi:thioredoxin-related protein
MLALGGLALAPLVQGGEAPDLPLAADLRADARLVRRQRVPLLVLFSIPGCPYCNEVRRSHLLPLLSDPSPSTGALVRQVNVGGREPVTGFGGEAMTHGELARAHGIRRAPVVAFWDDRGRPIAEPLDGMLLPDFYGAYLENALEAAHRRLAGPG